jgi:UV DNA damage endonuclease
LKTNILNINSENNLLGPICIRLGLCCLNNYLRGLKNSVFCSRTIILSTYKSKGKIEAVAKADQNVKDIEKMIRWNKEHYIDCLRLSSEIFPHYSNIKNIEKEDRYTLDFAKKDLELAGNLARKFGHRITMHPGHYNVVGSPNEEVFQKTIIDLGMHADILDMMKMDSNSIMVVHGGGVYGDKKKTIQRWIENFKRMPEKIQKRLVIENCEKNFSIIDCLEVNKELGIPVVFDNHHFLCYKQMHPDEEFQDIRYYIKLAIDTWIKKGLRPKFHISEQAPDKQVGAHSDYIKNFPDYYLEIPKKYGIGIDIMVEAKAKEAAVFDLYQKYPKNFIGHHKIDWEKENIKELFAFDKEKMSAIK